MIENTNTVILNGTTFVVLDMKLIILRDDKPLLRSNLREPAVISAFFVAVTSGIVV